MINPTHCGGYKARLIGWQSYGPLGYQTPLFECVKCLTSIGGDHYPLYREGDIVRHVLREYGDGVVLDASVGTVRADFSGIVVTCTPDQLSLMERPDPEAEALLRYFGVE